MSDRRPIADAWREHRVTISAIDRCDAKLMRNLRRAFYAGATAVVDGIGTIPGASYLSEVYDDTELFKREKKARLA